MKIAIFPGSFDPMTIGHMSVLKRSLEIFDEVVVVVGINASKHTAEAIESRIADVKHRVKHLSNVKVIGWTGLTIDAAKEVGARHIVRGIRSIADFEYELAMADINRKISNIETIFMPTLPEQSMISASVIRELKSYGYDTTEFEA